MMGRSFLLIVALAVFALSAEAFAPSILPVSSTTALQACRTNAKKEKRQRNRENMRKFKTGGKRGLSRRKILKKQQASSARQLENEFISKCFQTVPAPNSEE